VEERTAKLNEFPEKCQKCQKSHRPVIHSECQFCRDIGFQESTLCDLNRAVQGSRQRFVCHAFEPMTRPVLSLIKGGRVLSDRQQNKGSPDSLEVLLNSDRLKYQRALAVQKLQRDPDTVYMEIKYHLAWNVTARKSIFVGSPYAFDAINNEFSTCGSPVGGLARLLWLAPDHIHVYVESDGEKSVEAIVRYLKRISSKALREASTKPAFCLKAALRIWDKAYFSETLS
jgi:REP element-mobilizing transposase RayT